MLICHPHQPLWPQVRINTLLQRGTRNGPSPTKSAASRNAAAHAAGRQRREVSLAVVLERARARLQEARGGDVALREGLVLERPYVRMQPVDMEVDEGATVELTVSAGVSVWVVMIGSGKSVK